MWTTAAKAHVQHFGYILVLTRGSTAKLHTPIWRQPVCQSNPDLVIHKNLNWTIIYEMITRTGKSKIENPKDDTI